MNPIKFTQSLRFKLLLPVFYAIVFLALVLHFFWMPVHINDARDDFKQTQIRMLSILQQALTKPLVNHDIKQVQIILEQSKMDIPEWISITLEDSSGKRLYPQVSSKLPIGNEILWFTQKLSYQGTNLGQLTVASDSMNRIKAESTRIFILESWLLLLLALTGASFIWLQSRILLRPLKDMEYVATRMGDDDFLTLLPNISNDEVGQLVRAFEVMRDKRLLAENRLQLAASVFIHAREGILITDLNGMIVDVNDAFTRITGYTHEEACGKNPRMLKSGRQSTEYYTQMWQSLSENGHWQGEVWNRRKNGETYAEMITISAVTDITGKVQHYVALFTDITPMKEHQHQLEYIAHYDALTSLPNRVLLADRLEQGMMQSMRRERSLAVVYLDLDGFKAINDTYGHDTGDKLLVTVSERMKGALRDGDTLSRIGGDEFVAILVDLEEPEHCTPILERLLEAASEPVIIQDTTLRVSASMGVTIYPKDETDADLLLRHADQAMYVAKQAGKNRYHIFDVDQDEAVRIRHESMEQIRVAFEKREFVLYYQPKVNMKTGEVTGAEALIRWQHPERGLLPPANFLPIIENHPISLELGEWVIETALLQMEQWHTAGLDIKVSVNISAMQLQDKNFVSRLSKLLSKHPNIKPRCLELEILETSALEDMTQIFVIMHDCKKMGVGFALDDFGTGYSSLTYLKRLPVDVLKIDQSFIRGMINDTDDLAIVEGVIGLSTSFNREIIAEGVESIVHGQMLLSLGCVLAQGYAIARPMPAENMHNWVRTWLPDPSWTAWSGHALSYHDRMIVFVEVKHRHWLRDIDTYLKGARNSPPPMDAAQCLFGQWLGAEGNTYYSDRSEFSDVISLHEKVHSLGHKLLNLHQEGKEDEVDAMTSELHVCSAELIEKLRILISEKCMH